MALTLHCQNTSGKTVSFGKEYLCELYETGRSDKKHRYQPDIVRHYKRGIDYLKSARRKA